MDSIQDRVRELLREQGMINVDALAADTDLYAAGMNSLASVDLMLAVEQAFDLVFPDECLNRRTFSSIESIATVVERVTAGAAS